MEGTTLLRSETPQRQQADRAVSPHTEDTVNQKQNELTTVWAYKLEIICNTCAPVGLDLSKQ